MVDESIVSSVRQYLHNLTEQGIPVDYGVVYGSQATGKATEWSDIDLLVVSPQFDRPRKRADIDTLWIVAARTDGRIEPIAVGSRQYLEDDSSARIEMARREGQIIPLAK